ncbi:MAG: DUF2851 family protein [Planctomycetes bacterium]|nr:DUF2851 family protein [Planctomycetota bacterium]
MDSSFFSDEYLRICERTAVGESRAGYPESARMPVRERLVRCFWFDQDFATDDLRTADGRKLRVLSPGWWNLEAGPDFRNAVVRLANEPIVKGDVELHVDASAWYGHGHHEDPAYNSVILHVALRNDSGEPAVCNAAGQNVPQFILEPYLTAAVGELAEAVNPEDYPETSDSSTGLCNAAIREKAVDGHWLGMFFDYAGDQRALARMRRWEHLFDTIGGEAAIQCGVMEALGFKKNKSQFALLARLAPPAKLKEIAAGCSPEEKRLRIEAALFGLSGLLEKEAKTDPDEEAAAYIESTRARWEELKGRFVDGGMDARQWVFTGSRPVNFPTRRIAAAAAFLSEHVERGLLNALLSCLPPETGQLRQKDVTAARKRLERLFTAAEGSCFWRTRCTFVGKRMARPVGLVGKDRAALLLVNVVVPALLLYARRNNDANLEHLLHSMYVKLPRLPRTSVETAMVQRIFAGDEQAARIISNARRQQGLYQIFKDFCEKDDRGCRRCALLAELNKE